MGGGADKEQVALIPDLLKRKDNIHQAIAQNTFFFLICGGYQLFGQYYETVRSPKNQRGSSRQLLFVNWKR